MNKIPATLALYTSTKGHFKRETYRNTVEHILKQLPASYWSQLRANIKIDGEQDETKCEEMTKWLKQRGFKVTTSCFPWSHQSETHQLGYLSDIQYVTSSVITPYILHLEDDFLIYCVEKRLDYWLAEAIEILESNPEIVQVRIARWRNEPSRINGLKNRHGIDARAEWLSEYRFRHSDWSNNPFIARTRDIRNAVRLVFKTNLPKHSEHGLGIAMKMWSDESMPFVSFNPEMVRCLHQGCPIGEEDTPQSPLIAT